MKRLLGLVSMAGLVPLVALAPGAARASGGQGGGCIAHRPAYVENVFEPHYTAGCSGHDEPELDPVSAVPGSAKDITWTAVFAVQRVVLPSGRRGADVLVRRHRERPQQPIRAGV